MILRVVRVPNKREVTIPTFADPHSEINRVLAGAPVVFSADQLEVRRVEAASPHAPQGHHDVYWLNESRDGKEVHWDEGSETRAFAQLDFWRKYELFLREQQEAVGPAARAYMYWGFILPEQKSTDDPVIWRGLQSQLRLHFHIAEAIESDEADEWLDSTNPQHVPQIGRFLNVAGEKMREEVLSQRVFGEPFSYQQTIFGNTEDKSVKRTLHAFPTLAEALEQSLAVRNEIMSDWLRLASALSQAGPTIFSQQTFRVLQSAIPNFVFVLPSQTDKERIGRTAQEVWVAPFSVTGVPELLTHGGIHLDRR